MIMSTTLKDINDTFNVCHWFYQYLITILRSIIIITRYSLVRIKVLDVCFKINEKGQHQYKKMTSIFHKSYVYSVGYMIIVIICYLIWYKYCPEICFCLLFCHYKYVLQTETALLTQKWHSLPSHFFTLTKNVTVQVTFRNVIWCWFEISCARICFVLFCHVFSFVCFACRFCQDSVPYV